MATQAQREKRRTERNGDSLRYDDDSCHVRQITLKPETADENTRSVEAVLATDAPAVSTDSRTGKGVLEVWRMDGAEFGDRMPLCDNHNRSTVRAVLGSITNVRSVMGEDGVNRLMGRLEVSEAEPNIWTKVREGHLRDVSGGIAPLEGDVIPRGKSAMIRGQAYSAPKDRDLHVVTKWRLREVSLTPIGADPRAKIRSDKENGMDEKMRKLLEAMGLRAEATEDEAKAFLASLPVEDVTAKFTAKPAESKRSEAEPTKNAAPPASTDPETLRAEGIAAERKRVKEIERLGTGLPPEVVRKAIDESKSVDEAKDIFLEKHRVRTEAAAPAVHSRSHEQDCTPVALGLALAMRTVSGDDLYRIRAQYVPDGEGSGDYSLRRIYDVDGHKKAMERMLENADMYRGMPMLDIAREACRLNGKPVNLHTSLGETLRSAVSGSALSNIFTTNINAQFLTGYMDYNDTTVGWVSEADVNNFLTQERDTMGKFGSLQKVQKGRPADHLNTSDWKESYKIARYGGQFVVDEQDFINDRFGALESESPRDMGLSAAQLRPNLVYGIMLENAVLDVDSVALFDDTTHTNYKAAASGDGGPLAADSLQAAIQRMGKQRINGRVLNIRPRYLIVPQDLKFAAGILLKSAERVISTSDGGTYNPLKELDINLVVDDRIGPAGVVDPRGPTARAGTAVNWFLAARPGEEGAKTIEVGYLRGSGRAPRIRSFQLDKGQWGMGWDISFDIGAKALDFRAMYKAKGSS